MTLDLLATVVISVSATVVVTAFVALFGSSPTQRILIGTGMVLWFTGVLIAGGSSAIDTPLLGAGVLIPVVVMSLIGFGATRSRLHLESLKLPAMIALHTIRILGILFVLLYAAQRLPAPFAPTAGWGDILVGVTALPIAIWVERDRNSAWLATLFWNTFGLIDLVLAVGLGATSAPGPIRLFHGDPSSAIMGTLPWILIPCFLVPSLAFVHLIVFYRMLKSVSGLRTVSAPA